MNLSEYALLALFYIVIGIEWLSLKVREAYYILFRIPYYKGNGKFNDYLVRTDK